MTRSSVAVVLVAVLLTVTGCQQPTALSDEASCPGPTCTDDAKERLDVIASLDRVTGVEEVSRTYGFDRGAFHSAVVTAEVADVDEARDVALAVLDELDSWPGHDPGSAEVTVTADPQMMVTGAALEAESVPPYYEPCASDDCSAELALVRDRLSSELEGVSDLVVGVAGDRLSVSGRAEPEQATLAARAALMVLGEEAVALADRVVVSISYRMPLAATWRLVDGVVCEQPPGEAMVSCDDENSIPLGE